MAVFPIHGSPQAQREALVAAHQAHRFSELLTARIMPTDEKLRCLGGLVSHDSQVSADVSIEVFGALQEVDWSTVTQQQRDVAASFLQDVLHAVEAVDKRGRL